MKKITLIIFLSLLSYISYAECINDTENSYVASTNDGFVQTLASNIDLLTSPEYVTVTNLLIGHNYQFTSTRSGNDDYITVTNTSNVLIAEGVSPLNINAIAIGEVRIHVRVDAACNTDTYFHKATLVDLTIASTTCQKPTVDPTTTLTYRSDKRMDITWYAPEFSTPEGYEWEFVPQGGGTSISGSTTAPNTSISTGDVLISDTTYDISIRSTCGVNGVSAYTTFSIKTNANPPPTNDFCSGAITIIEQTGVADAASATPTAGTLLGGAGTDVIAESCGGSPGNARDDVWYKFIAQSTNVHITVEPNPNFDAVLTLYSGDCNSLMYLECSDVNVSSPSSEEINYTGLAIGQTYYTRTYSYGTTTPATPTFNIKIWTTDTTTDVDGDGYSDAVDCNDNDDTVYPGALEICDGKDNDCDGLVDDEDPDVTGQTTWYADGDGDGYGDPNNSLDACSQPSGYVSDNTDCDDTRFAVNPGVTEIEGNGLDDDCNPSTPDITLGITEFNLDMVKINPNPFKQSITIHIPTGYANDNFIIGLFDLNGREIFRKNFSSRNGIIKIEHLNVLQQGLYFIKISSTKENRSIVRELIKY